MNDDSVTPPTDDIMCATHRALCRHGYADLTMQDIADEWSKSKAALHYHYDTKRGLLLAFLDHLYENYTDRVVVDGETPRDRLLSVVEAALDPPGTDATRELRTALVEVKAQAPHDEGFRERLERFDRYLHERIREVIADGIERGAFRADADPASTATLLVTLVTGARSRRVALGDDDGVDEAIRTYIDERLATDAELPGAER